MKKLVIIFLIITILLSIGLWYALTHIAPYMIISPPRINETISLAPFGKDISSIDIHTKDSIILKGYHVKSAGKPKGTIILVHGIGGCKEHFLSLANTLRQAGFSSILCDLRAHGQSGGQYCTYGYYEKQDISAMVDYLVNSLPDTVSTSPPIGIWGNSLGGAVALQAMAVDSRIKFGVVESTFTELDIIVSDYQKRITGGLGLKPLTNYALDQAGKLANFDPNQVKPIESVLKIHQPVLIAHGDHDQNISVSYGKALYKALPSKDKELIIVPGGEHWGLSVTGGEKYTKQLFDFIERQTAESTY